MAFDNNPKSTPADVFIAGKTTEAVVRSVAAAMTAPGGSIVIEPGLAPLDVLTALVARFDRKAEKRAAAESAA